MTPGTALVLLGFGLGALVMAGQSDAAAPQATLRARADALRMRALEAQKSSAHASQVARDLMEKWSAAEDAGRREKH